MENHETLMKDSATDGAAKVIAKGDIITTVTTEKKAEEEKAEQDDAQMDAAETPEPAVTTPLRQDTKVICCRTGSVQSKLHLIWIKELSRGFNYFCIWFKESNIHKYATRLLKKQMMFPRRCCNFVFLSPF